MSSPENKDTTKTPFGKLVEELETSEGAQISRKLRQLGISYNVFFSNYSELKRALELFRRPDIAFLIWLPHNRETIDVYQRDVIRLLHNFVAGAKTLVEHSRNTIRELCEKTEYWNEYQDKVKNTFGNEPVIKFVEDLRNYALHKHLPYTTATFHMTNPPENSMMLNLDALRTSYKWTELSKKYLNRLGEKVNLESVINEYATIVIDFHKWLEKRQQEIHHNAFEKTGEIRERIREFVGPISPEMLKTILPDRSIEEATESEPEKIQGLQGVKLFKDPTGGLINQRIIITLFEFVDQYTDLPDEKKEQFLDALMFVGWNLLTLYNHLVVYISIEKERIEAVKNTLPIELDPTISIERDQDLYTELDEYLSQFQNSLNALMKIPTSILGESIWNLKIFEVEGKNIVRALERFPKKHKQRAKGLIDMFNTVHLRRLSHIVGQREKINRYFSSIISNTFSVFKSAKETQEIIYLPRWGSDGAPVSTMMVLAWKALITFVEDFTASFILFRMKAPYLLWRGAPNPDSIESPWKAITKEKLKEHIEELDKVREGR